MLLYIRWSAAPPPSHLLSSNLQSCLVIETALARMICGSRWTSSVLNWTLQSSMLAVLPFLKFILLLTFWTPYCSGFFFSPFWQFLFYLYPGVLSLPPKYWHSLESSLSIGIPLFFSCLSFCHVSEYSHYLPWHQLSWYTGNFKSLPLPQTSLPKISLMPGT